MTGVVVVGTGFGCLTHVRALRAAGFDVVALVGRDHAKTQARAQRFDIPHGLVELADALALPGADAVTIATPPHTHAAIAHEAISAGKHVLCEKPFARDAQQARSLLAAAEAAGVVHMLGTEFRFGSGQALATRLVLEGAIGTPRLATFLLLVPMLADPGSEVPEWWSDASQGGGWLGAQAAHVIDQVRVTLGEIEGVSATLTRVAEREPPWTADDAYTVHFRTAGGAAGVMQSTAAAWGPPVITTRFSGTDGTVWVEFDTVRVADAHGTREVAVPPDLAAPAGSPPPSDLLVTAYDGLHAFGIDVGPYTRLAETFLALIEGRRLPVPEPATFADGVAAMVVLDAIRSSAAAGGAWVPVENSVLPS